MPKPDTQKLAVDVSPQLHEAVFAEARHRDQFAKEFVADVLSAEPAVSKRLAALLKSKQPAPKHPGGRGKA